MNAQDFLICLLFGGIVLIMLYFIFMLLFLITVVKTIFYRKHPKFRIIKHVRENTLNPPGVRTYYTIEGKTIYGFWLNPDCCWCDPQRYETIKDAQRAKYEYEYNTTNKWIKSKDFNAISSEINRNRNRVKIVEKKKCVYAHYISHTEDPEYQLIVVRHRYEDIKSDNPIDITFYAKWSRKMRCL